MSISAPGRYCRIAIEEVYPEINSGRYPVKRCVGDGLEVWADILMDGHDRIKAVIAYQIAGEEIWHETPLALLGNDRWHGGFMLEKMGRYRFTIRAWPDRYGSWLQDTRKKREAGQDIALEMNEGQAMLERPLKDRKGKLTKPLQELMAFLNGKPKPEALADRLLSDETWQLADSYLPQDGQVSYERTLEVIVDRKLAEFGAWYEMFPRSQGKTPGKGSTFAECERRLPDIRKMGFDVVYLPPIHPIGVTARKGKNNALNAGKADPGSPYAIGGRAGGHMSVHPELGTLQDFRHFVKTARSLEMEVALDFAVQVSRDHPYIKEHPEWFSFRPDGTIKYAENPPKKYQDIVNVHFESGPSLWEELRTIVLFWIEQGVTIFRVDNPHTKPFAFWEWLIAGIHELRPDILFLSEAFTRPKIMYLLAKLGFTQSYSYFTWRNTKAELTEYLTELTTGWPKDYYRPNFFPTTPDILPEYLQKSGRPGFIIRLVLAATLGSNYGMVNGYELCEGDALPGKEEYADSEKYEFKIRDWDAPGNIKDFVMRLNRIRRENAALQQFKNLRFRAAANDQILFYSKTDDTRKNTVFIAVNLDYTHTQEAYVEMPLAEIGIAANAPYKLDDLLLGHSWSWTGARQHLRLDPSRNPVAIFRIQS